MQRIALHTRLAPVEDDYSGGDMGISLVWEMP
jgi:hypothetical protein